jgi:hypothetical protein
MGGACFTCGGGGGEDFIGWRKENILKTWAQMDHTEIDIKEYRVAGRGLSPPGSG